MGQNGLFLRIVFNCIFFLLNLLVKQECFRMLAIERIFFIFQIVNLMQYLVASQCPDGFKAVDGVSGRCYFYKKLTERLDASSSQKYCKKMHAGLYEPKSVEEMNIVEKSMVPTVYQNSYDGDYFTGYSFVEYTTKGLAIQQWIGINTLNYMTQNMWNKLQPQNYDGSSESACVIAAWDSFPSTGLDDIRCSYVAQSLICEYVIPENS